YTSFNALATPHIYALSLHDALPISLFLCQGIPHPGRCRTRLALGPPRVGEPRGGAHALPGKDQTDHLSAYGRRAGADGSFRLQADRKSTRLNSSHVKISYAVFCLKK